MTDLQGFDRQISACVLFHAPVNWFYDCDTEIIIVTNMDLLDKNTDYLYNRSIEYNPVSGFTRAKVNELMAK